MNMTDVKEWVDQASRDDGVTHVVVIEEMDISECYPWRARSERDLNRKLDSIDATCCVRLVVDMADDIAKQLADAGYVPV